MRELGLVLPSPAPPVANYVNAVRVGNLLFLAGHGECGDDYMTGMVGRDVTIDSASASARRTALCLLFGERGRHARAAVGMASLPSNASVEIEMLVEVDVPR